MKKYFMRAVSAVLIFIMITPVLSGCAGTVRRDYNKISVITTIFAPYDFVRQIAGERVELKMLLSPGSEAHSYEPSPQDIISIRECDVFIYVGGENDAWVDTILESVDTSDKIIIRLLECVDSLCEEEEIEGMEVHEHHGHEEEEEAEWDEHVWTSPVNAMSICESIENALGTKDPENAEYYREKLAEYNAALEELDETFRDIVADGKRDTIVFGDRFPARYFVEEYGLEYFAAFPGCASQSEASAATVAFLIDKVRDEKIPVVFKIELSNGNIAETIAADTGAKVLTFNTCHNLSKDDFENGATYLSLMYRNAEALKEALD